MNQLELITIPYTYKIDGQTQSSPHHQTDFIVDGQGLGQRFGFEENRPWFGQTPFQSPEAIQQNYRDQLLAKTRQTNQFGNQRVVLYACHCGCHYCGVISCWIKSTPNQIIWADVRYEEDDVDEHDDASYITHVIDHLCFEREAYKKTLSDHIDHLKQKSPTV